MAPHHSPSPTALLMGCRRDPQPAAGACWEERGRARAEPRPLNPALSHSSCREGIFSFHNPCLAGALRYLTSSNNPSRSGATQQHPEQQIPAQHSQAVMWHRRSPMGTCSSWEHSHQPAMPSPFQICSSASWQGHQNGHGWHGDANNGGENVVFREARGQPLLGRGEAPNPRNTPATGHSAPTQSIG